MKRIKTTIANVESWAMEGPKESDKQTNSESLNSLANALQEYVSKVIEFLEENSSKARFKPAE